MITVLCPSRGRPQAMRAAAASLVGTRLIGDTELVAVLDIDDPTANEYMMPGANYSWLQVEHEGGMVAALNVAVEKVLARHPRPSILGFIGDDHRFRTDDWDRAVEHELHQKPGFVYGDDGFWHKGEIPTQIFISREIVESLGYFALPDCHHLYVDNAWMELGKATDSIRWLHHILIEHMHPAIGKAEWDEGHKRVNSSEMYNHDRAAFEAWRNSKRFTSDVDKVRAGIQAATREK